MSEDARKRVISAAILLVGLASAVAIWIANPDAPDTTEEQLENTKKYLRAMETYGGKANLLASDLRRWFDGLWHGRTLAYTVAVLTLLVLVAYRLATMQLLPDDEDDVRR
jgi:hypothetical protein